MTNKPIENAKLGLLVVAGLSFTILLLYMIGKNRNLLGDTIYLHATIDNVNGLVPGNNVRFKGIDVGTVKSIELNADTTVLLTLIVDTSIQPYLKKNAKVSIGTDGLMGNKLVNIVAMNGTAETVSEGDVLSSLPPVDTENMLRTLSITNNTIEKITTNLHSITERIKRNNNMWSLLSDTILVSNLRNGMADLRNASKNTARLTSTASAMAARLDTSKGLVNALFMDTMLVNDLNYSIDELKTASHKAALVMDDVKSVINKINTGDGAAALLLNDSTIQQSLQKSLMNVEEGTTRFNENMEAMKSNFLFRRYYNKKQRIKRNKLSTQGVQLDSKASKIP